MVRWNLGAVLFLAWLLLACGGGVAGPPPKPAAVPHGLLVAADAKVLRAGEHFKARAEVLGMNVGRLEVNVMAPCSANIDPKWEVEAKMATAGVLAFFNRTKGVANSTIDPTTAEPTYSRTRVEDGGDWRNYEIWADPAKHRYRFLFEKSSGDSLRGRKPLPLDESIYDTQTALFALQAWQAEPKEKSYFYVILGRRLWRADVRYEGKRSLEHEGKKQRTLLFKGTAHRVDLEPGQEYTPKQFALWLTDDAERRPLKVAGDGSIGSITFYLEKHGYDAPCRPPDEHIVRAHHKRERRSAQQRRKAARAKAAAAASADPGSVPPPKAGEPPSRAVSEAEEPAPAAASEQPPALVDPEPSPDASGTSQPAPPAAELPAPAP